MNPSDSAFPVSSEKIGGEGMTDGGLTKREYIATQALIGVLALHVASSLPVPEPEPAAQMTVDYADALISELNKPKENKHDRA